jgi:hypothetical protein
MASPAIELPRWTLVCGPDVEPTPTPLLGCESLVLKAANLQGELQDAIASGPRFPAVPTTDSTIVYSSSVCS